MLYDIKKERLRAALLAGMLLLMAGRADGADITTQHSTDNPAQQPLVIYYSRTGTTFAIASAIAQAVACERAEIRSQKNRYYLGVLTCIFDQLLDRDDEVGPLGRDIAKYNPLIIVAPIWIHRFASPVRTVLKYSKLQGKDLYVVATNNGNFSEQDQVFIKTWLGGCGVNIQGFDAVQTKGRSFEDLSKIGCELASRMKTLQREATKADQLLR